MPAQKPTTDHNEIRTWAKLNNAVPCELLPRVVDSEPAVLRFMFQQQAQDRLQVRQITWDEFFLKFDALGLIFAYDEDMPSRNEILQIEEKSPYRHPAYSVARLNN